jgi:hypothetical protein
MQDLKLKQRALCALVLQLSQHCLLALLLLCKHLLQPFDLLLQVLLLHSPLAEALHSVQVNGTAAASRARLVRVSLLESWPC